MRGWGAQVEHQGRPVARKRRSSGGLVFVLGALTLTFASGARAERPPARIGVGYARIHSACQAPGAGYASCFALVRTPASSAEAASPGVTRFALRDGAASAGPAGGLTPAQIASAYGYDPADIPASEQTIAIVDAFDDPSIESDLVAFDSQYGLPQCTEADGCFKKVGQTGNANSLPAADTEGWSVEISLDVEMAHSACQHCRILLVEAENALFTNLGTAVNEAVGLGANEVSNSYGGPEGFSGEEAAYDHPGVVIAAATGDSGYNGWLDPAEFPQRPNLPASFPSVVAVGGTTLALNESGARAAETVWNGNGVENLEDFSQGATGGGCSEIFPAKPWQLAVAGFGATGCGSKRSVADVAAVADPRTGFDIYDSYNCGAACEQFKSKATNWVTIGGTSLSTPLISALYALAGGSNGISYPALTLYGHLGESSALFDVSEGGNGFCDKQGLACGIDREFEEILEVSPFRVDCEATTACNAAPGFDGPSALGTPNSLALFKPLRPSAMITSPAKLVADDPAAFSGTGSSDPYPGGTPLAYHWGWGDGAISAGPAPSHVFAAPGEYHVTLSVTDAYGVESLAGQSVVEVAESEAEARARKTAEAAAASSRGHGGVAGSKTAADPAVTLAQRALAVSSSGAVTLLLACPVKETRCTGTSTLRALGARGGVLVLAGVSFSIVGGGKKRVTLRLSKSARALLRRSGTLRAHLTILAHDRPGAHHTTILLVTLRAARRS
jgi:PKD domain